jgi:5-methylcytosine-specific restriction enzyme subunit McrC
MVIRKGKVVAVLDAKYRDLWERNLPREMLYQLALYAMGQEANNRRATILYPTLDDAARQQIIFVKDPLRGTAMAQVTLRPVNLLRLEHILHGKDVQAQSSRAEFAIQLVFGIPKDVSSN